jgi:hypothetical protein
MTWLDATIKQVRDFDAAKPRSLQLMPGWSEVGGCRSYLGFKLEGAWESDETDTWAAQRGTAIHEYICAIAAAERDVRIEVGTEYRGIPGHADIVEPSSVTDIKTTKLANSRLWADKPRVLRPKRIQAHGYAAGLVDAGELPEDATVRLLVVPVDGTFADWWAYEEPFDRALADEGADRLEEVRSRMLAGDWLPKDEPYWFCESWCEFFSVCRAGDDPKADELITDPELAAMIEAYGEAAQQATAADKVKKALAPQIRGLRGTTPEGWKISTGRPGEPSEAIDEAAVRADYEARGFAVPMTWKPGASPRLLVSKPKAKAAAK